MHTDFLTRNWALVAAAAIGMVVALFVLARIVADSARGRLRARARQVRRNEAKLRSAGKVSARASAQLERLRARSDSVAPRRLQEASDALADALALEKIAKDQVLVAQNQLRKLIVEEFSPRRQERLRKKYLVDAAPDGKPFTF